MLYWMIPWKSMFLHQNFRSNLPPSELNKWTIVKIHNDAEFAEDQFGTKIFYLCHWKSWENHTHRLCENRVDFVRRWTLEKILQITLFQACFFGHFRENGNKRICRNLSFLAKSLSFFGKSIKFLEGFWSFDVIN